jgi:hypothetical protein
MCDILSLILVRRFVCLARRLVDFLARHLSVAGAVQYMVCITTDSVLCVLSLR